MQISRQGCRRKAHQGIQDVWGLMAVRGAMSHAVGRLNIPATESSIEGSLVEDGKDASELVRSARCRRKLGRRNEQTAEVGLGVATAVFAVQSQGRKHLAFWRAAAGKWARRAVFSLSSAVAKGPVTGG